MAASGSSGLQVSTPSEREIVMTRVFDAPRDLVFEAHSSCEHLSHWWGPRKYEFASCEVDFRPGGAWRIVHRGPEGEDQGFHGEFREIVPDERIVSTEIYEAMPEGEAVNTLTLTEDGGRTTLSILVQHESKEHRDAHINSGMEAGLQEAMDRLEQVAISLR